MKTNRLLKVLALVASVSVLLVLTRSTRQPAQEITSDQEVTTVSSEVVPQYIPHIPRIVLPGGMVL